MFPSSSSYVMAFPSVRSMSLITVNEVYANTVYRVECESAYVEDACVLALNKLLFLDIEFDEDVTVV
jgi:hypothetical protein